MTDGTCDAMVTLGVEDEAHCELPLGHAGDHLQAWTTAEILGQRDEVEIRWRTVRSGDGRGNALRSEHAD